MKVTIIDTPNDVAVWVALNEGDPRSQSESFCIGGGETREEAITDALASLDAAKADLLAAPLKASA